MDMVDNELGSIHACGDGYGDGSGAAFIDKACHIDIICHCALFQEVGGRSGNIHRVGSQAGQTGSLDGNIMVCQLCIAGCGSLGLGGLGLGGLGVGGFGCGFFHCCMLTHYGLIQSIVAGVDTVCIISSIVDGILIDSDAYHNALTGSAGGGAGAGGGQIAAAHMGEVQGHLFRRQIHGGQIPLAHIVIPVPLVGSGNGHLAALGVVIVACLIVLMVVAVEESNIHGLCHFVDGVAPILCPGIVITVVVKGLVRNDKQGAVLLQLGSICLEVCDGFGNSGGKAVGHTVVGALGIVEACLIAVIAAQVAHAQRIDIVIAVVVGNGGAIVGHHFGDF